MVMASRLREVGAAPKNLIGSRLKRGPSQDNPTITWFGLSQYHALFIAAVVGPSNYRLFKRTEAANPPRRRGRAGHGSGAGLSTSCQLPSILVPPAAMSATNKVQVPYGSRPLNEFNMALRGSVSRTAPGSTLRPSGCQIPVSGEPA